jgi:hypothetical protein
MPDHLLRGTDLRAPVSTLEPDDALLARLSSLAAAGTADSTKAAPPRVTWRVGLAAASVAAVLVGIAWLSAVGPADQPAPSPSPATTPAGPDRLSTTAPTTTPAPRTRRVPTTAAGGDPGGSQGQPPGGGAPSDGPDQQPGQANSQGTGPGNVSGGGPDDHAGAHPNDHATQRADNAIEHTRSKRGHLRGGKQPR